MRALMVASWFVVVLMGGSGGPPRPVSPPPHDLGIIRLDGGSEFVNVPMRGLDLSGDVDFRAELQHNLGTRFPVSEVWVTLSAAEDGGGVVPRLKAVRMSGIAGRLIKNRSAFLVELDLGRRLLQGDRGVLELDLAPPPPDAKAVETLRFSFTPGGGYGFLYHLQDAGTLLLGPGSKAPRVEIAEPEHSAFYVHVKNGFTHGLAGFTVDLSIGKERGKGILSVDLLDASEEFLAGVRVVFGKTGFQVGGLDVAPGDEILVCVRIAPGKKGQAIDFALRDPIRVSPRDR